MLPVISIVFTVALLIVSATISGSSQANIVSFQGLGDLPGGYSESKALGISSDGSTVVGYSSSSSGFEAFRWSATEGISGLGFLTTGSFLSQGTDASSDGSVIVGSDQSASGQQAAKLTDSTGWQGIGQMNAEADSVAWGISDNGTTITGTGNKNTNPEAFKWTESGGMQGLGCLVGATFSFGNDISSDGGTIVGHSGTDPITNTEAFKWTQAGGMTGLGHPSSLDFSQAKAVSRDGSVMAGTAGTAGDPGVGSREAYIWTEPGQWQNLGDLPGGYTYAEALAISDDGTTVAGFGYVDSGDKAFIWDGVNGMRDLQEVLEFDCGLGEDLAGWTLTRATGISGNGKTIAGYGLNPDGYKEGWIATIPEPGTTLLLGVGTLILVRGRRAGTDCK